MVTRLVLRRDLRKRQDLPDTNTVLGYWVQMIRVRSGAILFWQGRWYEKMGGTICKLLDSQGRPALDSDGFECLQDVGWDTVPVFITTIDAWENPGYGHTPEAQNGPAPPKTL